MKRIEKSAVALGIGIAVGIGAGACTSTEEKQPIRIGLSASLTGFDAQWGGIARDVVVATVEEINATGGVNGHDLELVIRDDGSEPGPAAIAVQELIDEEVVAIVGGFWSNQLEAVTPMARDAQIPLLSPSATAPELVTEPPDNGFVFRTAPNDNFQSLAMAHYLADLAQPAVGATAIVHEDGSYGVGLANALQNEWVTERARTLSGSPIAFSADMDQAAADAVLAAIVSADPSNVVLVSGGSDANLLLRTWKASGQLPDLTWFLADAAKQSALFGEGANALPSTIVGVRGSAPTYPRTGIAFQTYIDVMLDRTGMDVSQEAYFPNTYDAVYLIAAGLLIQDTAGVDFGGAGLRDAIMEVSSGGQVFHAGQWRDLVSAIRVGGNVDYDGAAGPVDFDADGETVSPYEVWEARHESAAWTFAQVQYMEARDLTGE